MKKILTLAIVLALTLNLTACGKGGTTKEAKFTSMTFGDITISAPDVFNAVEEKDGMYVSSGPDSSIVVTPVMEIDLLPSEWDEDLAKEALDPLYGTTYTDMELSTFEGNKDMNGGTAVHFSFKGKNDLGNERLVQVVRLFNADQTAQYAITLVHSSEDKFFTSEVDNKIINSITLGN